MNISRRIGVTGLLAMVALHAWAAGSPPAGALAGPKFDLTGTWNGKSEGGRGPAVNYVFVFKQEKDKLTGSVSTNGAAPVEIDDGKIYKTKVTFSVSTQMPAMTMPGAPAPQTPPKPMTMTTKYEASVAGDVLTVTSSMGGMGGSMGGMGGGGGGPPGGGMSGGGGMGGGGRGGGGMGGGGMGGGMSGGAAPPDMGGGGGMSGMGGGGKTTITAKRQ